MVNFYNIGYNEGYSATRIAYLHFDDAWKVYYTRTKNWKDKDKIRNYYDGFLDGHDKYEDDYAMEAAYGDEY